MYIVQYNIKDKRNCGDKKKICPVYIHRKKL